MVNNQNSITKTVSFYSLSGYWVHRYVLRSSPRVQTEYTAQDVYSFTCTSKEEDGPKDKAMSVTTWTTMISNEDGHVHTHRPGYWNTNFSLERGRKLYKLLIKQGYSLDVPAIEEVVSEASAS